MHDENEVKHWTETSWTDGYIATFEREKDAAGRKTWSCKWTDLLHRVIILSFIHISFILRDIEVV